MKSERLTSHVGPVVCVVGARPNFMKMAPILTALEATGSLRSVLVHTGQHYDVDMNDRLFADLRLPHPDVNLGVGSGSHAQQTADIMIRFEPIIDEHQPSCVLVVGDVNSTIACSLVASKKSVPVVHVEAGLRSYDRNMPEEINRVLTDQLADLLFTTERGARDNLMREGVDPSRIRFVGNVMIDSLRANLAHAQSPEETLQSNGYSPTIAGRPYRYAVVTLHRPSNVDSPAQLKAMLAMLVRVAQRLPVLIALHPRTRANVTRFGLERELSAEGIVLLPPQGYLQMLGLLSNATFVITDSGGVQEETTALGVPCLTVRENTERPITITEGTNTLLRIDSDAVMGHVDEILAGRGKRGRIPELWDGRAAERLAAELVEWLATRSSRAAA